MLAGTVVYNVSGSRDDIGNSLCVAVLKEIVLRGNWSDGTGGECLR